MPSWLRRKIEELEERRYSPEYRLGFMYAALGQEEKIEQAARRFTSAGASAKLRHFEDGVLVADGAYSGRFAVSYSGAA